MIIGLIPSGSQVLDLQFLLYIIPSFLYVLWVFFVSIIKSRGLVGFRVSETGLETLGWRNKFQSSYLMMILQTYLHPFTP